jgi:hypothetical protein
LAIRPSRTASSAIAWTPSQCVERFASNPRRYQSRASSSAVRDSRRQLDVRAEAGAVEQELGEAFVRAPEQAAVLRHRGRLRGSRDAAPEARDPLAQPLLDDLVLVSARTRKPQHLVRPALRRQEGGELRLEADVDEAVGDADA